MAGRKVTVHVIESAIGHLDDYPDGRIELFPGDEAPDWLELGDHCFEKQEEVETPLPEGAGVEGTALPPEPEKPKPGPAKAAPAKHS
jgi:hypothetical protein